MTPALALLRQVQIGRAFVVTAITSGGQPIGSLILASFFLRHRERLDWPVVSGTVFIVAGIHLLTS